MRILYLAQDLAPYSGVSHEVLVAAELARAGHDVHVVVEREPKWSPEQAKPETLSVQVVTNLNEAGAAARIAEGLPDAEVGFASSVSGAPALAVWKRRTKGRAVAQVLDCPLWRLKLGRQGPWLESWRPWYDALWEMDGLVANTNQTVSDLREARHLYGHPLGVRDVGGEATPWPETQVVYYGIDVATADLAKPAQVEAAAADAERYPIAVGASRLVAYKGFDLAIAALANRKHDPIAYYVIGAGEDLWRLVQMDVLLYGACNFLGGVPDAVKFSVMKAGEIGLNLAYNRHIPLQNPMESVYCGKPCVVADIPVNRERFLDHGVHYCDPCDQKSVNVAIDYALDGDKDMARHQEWIRENRSFQSHAKGVLDVLRA